jgi:hypothetical protein
MVSLVSADGMHQLHIFVFFLAVFHVTFSFFTMSLGRAKVWLLLALCWFSYLKALMDKGCKLALIPNNSLQTRIWKVWEKETCSPQYNYLNGTLYFDGWLLFLVRFYAKKKMYNIQLLKPLSLCIVSLIFICLLSSCFGFSTNLQIYVIYLTYADPSKFRLTHQTSFVRQHASCWSKSTITLYFVSHFMAPFCGYNKFHRLCNTFFSVNT